MESLFLKRGDASCRYNDCRAGANRKDWATRAPTHEAVPAPDGMLLSPVSFPYVQKLHSVVEGEFLYRLI